MADDSVSDIFGTNSPEKSIKSNLTDEPVGNESYHDQIINDTSLIPCGFFAFVIYGPLYGIVCLLGLIGNSLSFAVLHRYSQSNVATYLLKTLAITDNLFLATAAGVQMYPAMSLYFNKIEQLEPVYPYIQNYGWPLVYIVQTLTVYVTVLVAANRFIAVCFPFHAHRFCSKNIVKFQLICIVLGAVIYNIPRFFDYNYKVVNHTDPDTNETVMEEVNFGLAGSKAYNIAYENIAYCLFVFLIPLTILIIFNVLLLNELKSAKKHRKSITRRKPTKEENNITLVMVVIILMFIVCQTPASINQILYYIVPQETRITCGHYLRYYHICNLLIIINSSVNFIIYCVFRRQFRQQFLALLSGQPPDTLDRRSTRRRIIVSALHNHSEKMQATLAKTLRSHPLSTVHQVTVESNIAAIDEEDESKATEEKTYKEQPQAMVNIENGHYVGGSGITSF